MKDNGTDCLNK